MTKHGKKRSKEEKVKVISMKIFPNTKILSLWQHGTTLMSQRSNKRKGKGTSLPQSQRPLLLPPSVAITEEENQQIRMIPTPPNIVRRELRDTDSERTISTGPSTSHTLFSDVLYYFININMGT